MLQSTLTIREKASIKYSELQQTFENTLAEYEKIIQERDIKVATLNDSLETMHKDFVYNLKLIEERDQEIIKLQGQMEKLQTHLTEKDIQIAELKCNMENAKKMQIEIKAQNEIELERKDALYQKLQNDLQDIIQQYDNCILSLKREAEDEITSILRREEEEKSILQELLSQEKIHCNEQIQQKDFEQSALCRAYDLRVAELERNCDFLQKNLEEEKKKFSRQSEILLEQESLQSDLRNQLQNSQWDLNDTKALLEAKINEIQKELTKELLKNENMQKDYNAEKLQLRNKLNERENEIIDLKNDKDQLLKEEENLRLHYDDCLEKLKSSNSAEIGILRSQLDEANKLLSSLEKEVHLSKLDEQKQKTLLEVQLSEKEIEVQSLSQEFSNIKTQLNFKQDEIEVLKNELSSRVERESKMKQEHLKEKLNWEKTCQNLLLTSSGEHNTMISKVIEENRALQAETKLLKGELIECQEKNGQLQEDLHKFIKNDTINPSQLDTQRVSGLVEENEKLRDIITKMREEMESVAFHRQNTKSAMSVQESPYFQDDMSQNVTKDEVKIDSNASLKLRNSVRVLKQSLYRADSEIKRLSWENEQLLDMCNGLRAELKEFKQTSPHLQDINEDKVSFRESNEPVETTVKTSKTKNSTRTTPSQREALLKIKNKIQRTTGRQDKTNTLPTPIIKAIRNWNIKEDI